MLRHIGLVRTCIIGAALSGTVLFSTGVFAQQGCCEGGFATGANSWTNGLLTSAQWPTTTTYQVAGWWTHGSIEIGGRDFVNNPNQNGSLFGNIGTTPGGYTHFGQQSLGKYYEYGIEAPGAFGGGHVATGSRDGLYQVDLWANNVASNFAGFSDQSYLLTASKIGEQYFAFSWDQSPHIYSTSAQTPYVGVGTSALTLPPGAGNRAQTVAGLVPFLHQQDIGINRDTAAATYRWTPTEAWDINADYSHMDRTGTQVAGLAGLEPAGTARTSSAAIQVPAPVDDTTQNFGANGEYEGTSFWGKKFTFKVAYNGSQYTDNLSNYTVQNPFCSDGTSASCAFKGASPFATMSTPPSNQANAVTGTLAADLPWQSRYVGTFDYTRMTQSDGFQAMTNNPSAFGSPFFGGLPWNQVNFGFVNGNFNDPVSSLNGRIDTFLSNNQLTTKITPELTQKMTYRYYDFANDTPRIIFPCWVSLDQIGPGAAPAPGSPCGAAGAAGIAAENTISSLTVSYIKQNAGYELNWRPSREWNFNAAYGYERYNYNQTDYNITNENSGKLSADWKPVNWFTLRASGYYADRRYDVHDYPNFVQSIQFPTISNGNGTFTPTTSSWFYSSGYQQFMFDNRQQTKANLAADIVVFRGVTVTPTIKYQDDNYGINPLNEDGVNYNRQTSTGVDVGWVISPDLSLAVSYYWENYNLNMYNNISGNGTSTPPFGGGPVVTFDKETVNTVTAAVSYAAIPDKLNLDVRYLISLGVDQQICPQCVPSYPNDNTLFERLDATATYRFDPTWVHAAGFKGDLKAKLRYTWERNSVNNWQNDSLAPFTPFINSASSSFLWLASDNPNYNVQIVAASLMASW